MMEHANSNERSTSPRTSYNRNNRSYTSILISWTKFTIIIVVYFWLLLFGVFRSEWNATTVARISTSTKKTTNGGGDTGRGDTKIPKEKDKHQIFVEDVRGLRKLQHIHEGIIRKEQEWMKKQKEDIMIEKQKIAKEKEEKERMMKGQSFDSNNIALLKDNRSIGSPSNTVTEVIVIPPLVSNKSLSVAKNTTKVASRKDILSKRSDTSSTNITNLRKPKYRGRAATQSSAANKSIDRTFPLLVLFSIVALVRVITTICLRVFLPDNADDITAALQEEDNNNDTTDLSIGSFLLTRRGAGPFLRRRRRPRVADAPGNRRARYIGLVERLNRTRAENGERPISAESLRLVLSTRDFNGNDYDHLLQFNEENGPAMNAFLSSIGATPAEIERCPSHVIQSNDDLLTSLQSIEDDTDAFQNNHRFCSICLEGYEIGQTARTIPCFHTFHAQCIDRWLTQKAECPICKFPALG